MLSGISDETTSLLLSKSIRMMKINIKMVMSMPPADNELIVSSAMLRLAHSEIDKQLITDYNRERPK